VHVVVVVAAPVVASGVTVGDGDGDADGETVAAAAGVGDVIAVALKMRPCALTLLPSRLVRMSVASTLDGSKRVCVSQNTLTLSPTRVPHVLRSSSDADCTVTRISPLCLGVLLADGLEVSTGTGEGGTTLSVTSVTRPTSSKLPDAAGVGLAVVCVVEDLHATPAAASAATTRAVRSVAERVIDSANTPGGPVETGANVQVRNGKGSP
jgi:hypothetical protein